MSLKTRGKIRMNKICFLLFEVKDVYYNNERIVAISF